MRRRGLLVVLLLAWAFPARSAQPTLVKDVNPDLLDSQVTPPALSQFVSVGARAVFVLSRNDPNDFGSELWASDGTDGGTELLRSFARSHETIKILGSTGRVAFALVTPTGFGLPPGPSLWRTDGSAAGTFALTGPLSYPSGGFQFLVSGGALFFSACTAGTDCEPWISDGTPTGTHRLRDLAPGPYGSEPRELVEAAGKVWFFADTPAGPGLWQTDGTRQGTRRVALLSPYANPHGLAAAGSRLYFLVGPSGYGTPRNALWTSDGTAAGTRPVPPFGRANGRGPAAAQLLAAVGNLEYFMGVDPALGWQLYRTDGTRGGTRRLSSFSGSAFVPDSAVPLDGCLLFLGPDGQLWASDGTRAGTAPLAGCAGGCPKPDGSPLVVNGGLAFFNGLRTGEGYEPWVTDGTPAGTRRLVDLCAGACGSNPAFGPVIHGQVLFYSGGNLFGTDGTSGGTHLLAFGARYPSEIPSPPLVAAAGPRLVFAGFDPSDSGTLPVLKSTEGTPESERTLDLRLADGAGSSPHGFTALGDKVLFFACSSLGNVWATGGTPETTVPLTDAREAPCEDSTLHFTVLNGVAYFKALGPEGYWHELWRTDGTPAGTYPVTHMGPDQEVMALTTFQGKLFVLTSFIDNDPTKVHSAVWTSDGTAAGTTQAFELAVRYVRELHTVGNAVYFSGQDANYTTALFRSDGTKPGTVELTRIANDVGVSDFQTLGGQVFFLVPDHSEGSIWKTDGTPGGTRQLIPPGHPVSEIQDLAQLGGQLYFLGLDLYDPSTSQGLPTLFRSDGTTAGTVRLKAFSLDANDPLIPYFLAPQLTAAGGSLYFVAADDAHGSELWKSDGSAAGTVLVKDIRPGPEDSRISSLTAVGDRVYFAADDGEHGVELWTSDGTAAGTRMVADLSAGPTSSAPQELTPIGNRLFFSADDGVVGREPWVLPLDAALAGRIVP